MEVFRRSQLAELRTLESLMPPDILWDAMVWRGSERGIPCEKQGRVGDGR
jgi:hypothetical protein